MENFDGRKVWPILTEEQAIAKECSLDYMIDLISDLNKTYLHTLEYCLEYLIPTTYNQEELVGKFKEFKEALVKFINLKDELRTF
jgi:hypothetical protein